LIFTTTTPTLVCKLSNGQRIYLRTVLHTTEKNKGDESPPHNAFLFPSEGRPPTSFACD